MEQLAAHDTQPHGQLTLSDWLEKIATTYHKPMDFDLSRIKMVAAKLKLLDHNTPIITIAGTNGKGSTAHLLSCIYTKSGLNVGLYTSPHLMAFNERIRINHQPVSDELLCDAFKNVDEARGEIGLTYFEFATLCALKVFLKQSVELIVLEVGLGGRLDATNIFNPTVSVITSIDLDHMEWLGNTRELIAKEKAGIFRQGGIAVVGESCAPDLLREQALSSNMQFSQAGREYQYHQLEDSWSWAEEGGKSFSRLPVPPIHLDNAAAAIKVISVLSPRFVVSEQVLRETLASFMLPGRCDVVCNEPLCVIDVSHNPHATRHLANFIKKKKTPSARVYAIVGMLGDKDIAHSLLPMIDVVDDWRCISLNVPRGAKADELSKVLSGFGVKNQSNESVVEALESVSEVVHADDCVVVFGSFYTAEQAYRTRRVKTSALY